MRPERLFTSVSNNVALLHYNMQYISLRQIDATPLFFVHRISSSSLHQQTGACSVGTAGVTRSNLVVSRDEECCGVELSVLN